MKASYLLGSVLVALSINAHSAQVWRGPFTIQDITMNYLSNGFTVVSVYVPEKTLIGSTCPLAVQQGMVSYWGGDSPTNINVWHTSWLSMLMAAQAQDKKIMLQIDTARCSPTSGAYFEGIRLIKN